MSWLVKSIELLAEVIILSSPNNIWLLMKFCAFNGIKFKKKQCILYYKEKHAFSSVCPSVNILDFRYFSKSNIVTKKIIFELG